MKSFHERHRFWKIGGLRHLSLLCFVGCLCAGGFNAMLVSLFPALKETLQSEVVFRATYSANAYLFKQERFGMHPWVADTLSCTMQWNDQCHSPKKKLESGHKKCLYCESGGSCGLGFLHT